MIRRTLPWLLATLMASPAWPQGAPPPTPVPPYGSPSPYPTALATPEPSTKPPKLSAGSAALADLETGEVLWGRHADTRRSIASVTKIMTAMLVLEETAPGEEVVVSPAAAAQEGAELGLEPGERVPARKLLFALMLQSSNDAAVALAEHVAGSVEGFVKLMNLRARALGLRDTRFRSPNGLDDRGLSTARELVVLTVEAYRTEGFAEVVATKQRTIPAPSGPARRIQNRNALLWLYDGAIGVKTGYTAAAGFCLVAAAERDGLPLVAVVLGAPHGALDDAAAVLNFGYEAWERRTLVEEGDAFDPLPAGPRSVPVEAGASLALTVHRDAEAETEVRADPPRLPVADGAEVGEVVVTVDGEETGRVPLLAASAVRPPPPPEPDPWWKRVWRGILEALASAFHPVTEPSG